MYQVIQNAGQDNQTILIELATFEEALTWIQSLRRSNEVSDLGDDVDILKNGSTEY